MTRPGSAVYWVRRSCGKNFIGIRGITVIWSGIFRKAEKVRPSFNLVKTGASLGAIGKDSFKIIVRTEFVKNIIEKESRLLSEFMEEETGRKLKPVCRLEGMDSEEDSAEEKAREIAEEVKAKFHIDNVTVE